MKMAQIKRSVRPENESVFTFIFLCRSPYFQLFILPQQWNNSPLSPSISSLTADDFATLLMNKTKSISSQFSAPHMQELKPTTSTAKPSLFSFCPITKPEVSKLLFSSHPTACPHTFSKQSPLHSYQHSHLPHYIQAGSGSPTAKKKLH